MPKIGWLLAAGALAEAFRNEGSLAATLHTALLPLLNSFSSSRAAATGLGGISQILADDGQAMLGSLQEHLLSQLDKQVS